MGRTVLGGARPSRKRVTHLCGVRMSNSNKISKNVKGKKLLRGLFSLNGFFPFQISAKELGSIVRVFVMMLPSFFCGIRGSGESGNRWKRIVKDMVHEKTRVKRSGASAGTQRRHADKQTRWGRYTFAGASPPKSRDNFIRSHHRDKYYCSSRESRRKTV